MLISPWLLLVWRACFQTARGGKRTHQQQHHLICEISFFEILGRILTTCFFDFCENRLFFFTGVGAERSCGARAFLSGRLGCCGLPGAPAAHGLSFLVVWAAAACRALLRRTGFPFWSFGLLRLAGRSCGALAFLSGRLGCCGLPGALAAHGLYFLVVWAAAACRALLRCTGEEIAFSCQLVPEIIIFPGYLNH